MQPNKSKAPVAAGAKKNEIQELKDDLINNNELIKKEAVRKVWFFLSYLSDEQKFRQAKYNQASRLIGWLAGWLAR